MRLQQYLINEKGMPISAIRETDLYKKISPSKQKEFEATWKNIKKDCQPFLKQLMKQPASGTHDLLYRNMNVKGDIGSLAVRMDREPRDTPKVVHDLFDDILEDVFGYRARSKTIFCSGVESWGGSYGSSYVIFPKGSFKFLWSERVKDSYDEVCMTAIKRTLSNQYEKETKELIGKSVPDKDVDDEFDMWLYDVTNRIKYDDLNDDERKLIYMALEYNILERINYKEDNLIKAIKSEHEIMIFCKDYYYLSTYEFESLIKLFLWGSIY
ncbi:MAG: hypothetical protein KQ78_00460 [Candidatus Izimaplasma bacterium HR2]|nr:MAG: hypothetical protein KQ78_00460 [Candidatus Izimaplasma bacterium HR2]